MADPPPTPPAPTNNNSQSTSSYIYPVRSLLSGIQPAPDSDGPPQAEPNILLASLRRDAQARAERQATQQQLPPPQSPPPPGLGARRGNTPQGTLLPIVRGSLPFLRDESIFSAPLPTKPEASSPTFFNAPSQVSSPLARRQSTTNSPEMAARRVVSGLETRAQPPTPDVTSPAPSAPEPFRHYPAEGRDGFLRLLHLPEGTPIATPTEPLSNSAGMAIMMHDSVDGAVIRNSVHGSKASASNTGTSNAGTDASAQVSGAGSVQPSGVGSVQQQSVGSSIQPPAVTPISGQVTTRSGTTSLSETTSDEPLVTVRFQHVQDEHGNHVVVGREGRLARCEDEPIRVPGAVQGFGVLIALEEDYETGNLVVRQVSENASELLGLTPKFLFSLDCFTQTLPDSQADILWDNVQFLHDPELEPSDTADDSPQVFLLSGWGEPGSGLRDGGYFAQGAFGPAPSGERAGPRREWTCWCAAHRPKQPVKARDFPSSEGSSAEGYPDPNQFDDDDADTSPLIVLEFELERDVFNPLYPPYSAALPIESPGLSSRGSGTNSAGTGGTNSAGTGGTGGTGESSVTQHQQEETPKQEDHGGKSASLLGSVLESVSGSGIGLGSESESGSGFGSELVTAPQSKTRIGLEPQTEMGLESQTGMGPESEPGSGSGTSNIITRTTHSRFQSRLWLWLPWLVICWILSLFIPVLTRPPVVVVAGKDEQDGLPADKQDKPTGVGHDAIEGTRAEDGATGQTIGEGVAKAELVVPVIVGTMDEEGKDGDGKGEGEEVKIRQGDDTTPTAVPAPTPRPDHGEVTSPGGSGAGTGQSSGTATVMSGNANVTGAQGTVTNPSSEITPTQYNSGGNSGDGELSPTELRGLVGEESWYPSAEDVVESTTSRSRPLRALERMRRITRDAPGPRRGGGRRFNGGGGSGGGVGTMDVFAVLAQVNDQLGNAPDLDSFLKVVVGVIKDLTQFHRVLVYQFDEQWNGQVVAELVDWSQTHDLFKGLHFPAADIPAQARELYTINKVRLLYDRSQTTARLVVRDRTDLENPLDMTHSCLRAMSPIHIKYLANMGVRASMSISIVTFGQLWGLIACHSYGPHGMRVSFPVRQMLRLLSDSISRNIERLSYAQRLHTRKLISTVPTEQHPTGYIVSDAEDLISLFDADFGVLVIGEGAKILGPNEHGQETLIVAEYLRLKQFNLMQVSQAIVNDFPDLKLPAGHDVIAGLLYVPLSSGGKDFIALMRKGQLRDVHWAGKPFKTGGDGPAVLEPRKSFKAWKETVSGRCRAWTDEQLETAGVLALVYGKFIEVWRQKEIALKTNQLTNLLLSNASHEVRTPLNHIINYLEMALNGPLDSETRENLTRSHTASRSLLFTINDLLDLTRHETGNETSFNEPFDLPGTVEDAVTLYRIESMRRQLQFVVDTSDCPQMVIGDSKKIRTVVSNLTANAVKYTETGQISVECRRFKEPVGLRDSKEVAVEIVVADTGCGISSAKLESIFREFEQVESSIPRSGESQGLGLGLAVVARIVEQLGGQLRVDSKPQQGSRFSFLIPFALPDGSSSDRSLSSPGSGNLVVRSRKSSMGSAYASAASASVQSANSRIEDIVDAISAPMGQIGSTSSSRGASRLSPPALQRGTSATAIQPSRVRHPNPPPPGVFEVESSRFPVRGVKVDEFDADRPPTAPPSQAPVLEQAATRVQKQLEQPVNVGVGKRGGRKSGEITSTPLRILVVEDDDTNRKILCKRLVLDGHEVQHTTNGQEAVQKVENDREWDCLLMDIQMPILDGFGATKAIRKLEAETPAGSVPTDRVSMRLNGRIPIFAVSASLREKQREEMHDLGMDGWILKPIGFDRLRIIMKGITDLEQRQRDKYQPGKWEVGGWLGEPNPILGVRH